MKNLTQQDFDGRTGTAYEVAHGDGAVTLTLHELEAMTGGAREDAFRLIFHGPADPVLPQAIYPFSQDGEVVEIFIVPIGRTASGIEYEAIFN